MRMPEQPVLVYVAGASREHERVKRWADALVRSERVALSLRWFDDAAHWAGRDHHLPLAEQRPFADRAELAIRASRIFWMLWPEQLSPGSFIEYGYALAHRFHVARAHDVVVSGPGSARSIFAAAADYRNESDPLACEHVLALAERHRPLMQQRLLP
jgi:hypothetical protein